MSLLAKNRPRDGKRLLSVQLRGSPWQCQFDCCPSAEIPSYNLETRRLAGRPFGRIRVEERRFA